MSVQNGDVVILQIGGVQVGALVSNSQNMTADMLEKNSKDVPGIKAYDAGEDGWTLSVEALWDPAASEGFSEALGYLKAGTEITVLHGITGTQTFSGAGLIASIDVSGPKNEISSYSLEIQGTRVFGYSEEYQAVLDAMATEPSIAIATAQDTMVKALITAGVWAKLDVFFMFAQTTNGGSEALINWINPGTFDASLVNTPAFVALEGFTGNGSTSYIHSNWTPSTDGINWGLDSASYGIYIRTDVDEVATDMGSHASGSTVSKIIIRNSNTVTAYVNATGSTANANADARGFYVMNRALSTHQDQYKNGSLIEHDAIVSTGNSSVPFYILAYRLAANPAEWSTKQASVAFMGGGLTADDVTALTNAIEIYMDSNSKGVIA